MTMSMTMSMSSLDTRRRTSLPHLSFGSSNHLTEEERAAFIVASSTRRPSVPHFYPHPHHHHHHTSGSSSPPSASYSPSSSGASSPREIGNCSKFSSSNTSNSKHGGGCCIASSPILTPFQWTSDLRQYIMTDIGPQPSNSQMPTLRSHSHLVRQRSCVKISPVCLPNGGCDHMPCSACSTVESSLVSPTSTMTTSSAAAYSRYSTITDLCTIPQDEVLPPMKAPLERRFSHEEWDDEDD